MVKSNPQLLFCRSFILREILRRALNLNGWNGDAIRIHGNSLKCRPIYRSKGAKRRDPWFNGRSSERKPQRTSWGNVCDVHAILGSKRFELNFR